MHMHRAADLVTDEPIWLKKAPGYFSFVAAGHEHAMQTKSGSL